MSKKTEDKPVEVQVPSTEEDAKKPTMKAGKAIIIEATTRAEAKSKLNELRSKAKAEGFTKVEDGFIQFVESDKFIATITFNK